MKTYAKDPANPKILQISEERTETRKSQYGKKEIDDIIALKESELAEWKAARTKTAELGIED